MIHSPGGYPLRLSTEWAWTVSTAGGGRANRRNRETTPSPPQLPAGIHVTIAGSFRQWALLTLAARQLADSLAVLGWGRRSTSSLKAIENRYWLQVALPP